MTHKRILALSEPEASLIKQALHEFVDPDEERQEMIANILRKLIYVR